MQHFDDAGRAGQRAELCPASPFWEESGQAQASFQLPISPNTAMGRPPYISPASGMVAGVEIRHLQRDGRSHQTD
ncbi:MAG: hypothetical protein IPL28_15395 [Chloroflexi bacterium]|nr:hypothetical protein [Chloroflexota bacterium]